MALQGTAVGQECLPEATNVKTEFVGVKEEPFDEESGILARPLQSQAAVQLEAINRHHALDTQYQKQHEAPPLDEFLDKPTQDKDNHEKLPSILEKMVSESDKLAKKKGTKRKRRKQHVSLHSKLLESQLEMVKLMNKNAELELNIKNAILVEKLKQEKLKSEILGLRLK